MFRCGNSSCCESSCCNCGRVITDLYDMLSYRQVNECLYCEICVDESLNESYHIELECKHDE
jgi:hypothetical protein